MDDIMQEERLADDAERPIVLSVVIPAFNEEGSIAALAANIDRALASVAYRWECVWVDDGSTDDTWQRLCDLEGSHRYIRLDKNTGQSAALMAGVEAARGAWIGTLDADGQNDPADLPRQLEIALQGEYDMVNGVRAERRDSWVRRISSRLANAYRRWMLDDGVTDVGCSTRVVDRAFLVDLPFFHGIHRYLPALVAMQGGRIHEVAVQHHARVVGESKYGVNNRLWVGLEDVKGVRWLRSRHRTWRVAEAGGNLVSSQEKPHHAA